MKPVSGGGVGERMKLRRVGDALRKLSRLELVGRGALLSKLSYANPAHVADYEMIRESGLFDTKFYLEQLRSRGISTGRTHPIEHYFLQGDALRVPPNPLFDPHFYHEKYPDVGAVGFVSLVHFLRHGEREGRDPHPMVETNLLKSQLGADFAGNSLAAYLGSSTNDWQPHFLVDPDFIYAYQRVDAPFDSRPSLLYYMSLDPYAFSPSRDFSAANYLDMYPDIKTMHPLYHYARYGRVEGRHIVKERNSARHIASQILEAAELDPDILRPYAEFMKFPSSESYDVNRMEYKLTRRLTRECGADQYEYVFMTPWLKRGGAERVLINFVATALKQNPSARVLILCTEADIRDALSWLPATDRVKVVFIKDVIDNAATTYIAFSNWLGFLGCRCFAVMNSEFGWNTLAHHGRSLAPNMRTIGFAFCYDYDKFGRRAGFAWTHMRRALPGTHRLISDNAKTVDQFCRDLFLGAADRAKFSIVYQPVEEGLRARASAQVAHNVNAGAKRRHVVLWAGRFHPQKGIEVAAAIARALPQFDFLFCGGTREEWPAEAGDCPRNARFEGEYKRFAELPLHEASMFLHTSHWDGLPNVLLEAGYCGLPVIATDVGGVSDLVDEKTGWLVAHKAEAAVYAEALRDVLAHPRESLAKCQAMIALIDERHSFAHFEKQADAAFGADDAAAAEARS